MARRQSDPMAAFVFALLAAVLFAAAAVAVVAGVVR